MGSVTPLSGSLYTHTENNKVAKKNLVKRPEVRTLKINRTTEQTHLITS